MIDSEDCRGDEAIIVRESGWGHGLLNGTVVRLMRHDPSDRSWRIRVLTGRKEGEETWISYEDVDLRHPPATEEEIKAAVASIAGLNSEPPRWSVVCDKDDRIWMRIGDHDGKGIWMDTGERKDWKSWDELEATAILSIGLLQPSLL